MRLIQIGNSRGVRIPAALIKQAGLEDCELELKVIEDGLLLRPVQPARQGWAEAFKSMHSAGDDKPLLDEVDNTFDEDEWAW